MGIYVTYKLAVNCLWKATEMSIYEENRCKNKRVRDTKVNGLHGTAKEKMPRLDSGKLHGFEAPKST